MWWMGLGCAPSVLDLQAPDTFVVDMLTDAALRHDVSERADVRTHGEAALGWGRHAAAIVDAPPGSFHPPQNLTVFDVTDTHAGVIVEDAGIRLAMTVRQADLWQRVLEDTEVLIDPHAPNGASVLLDAGTRIEDGVLFGEHHLHTVDWRGDDVDHPVDVWVPAQAAHPIHHGEPRFHFRSPSNGTVLAGWSLLDGPGGDVLVPPQASDHPAHFGDRIGDAWVWVTVDDGHHAFRGVIATGFDGRSPCSLAGLCTVSSSGGSGWGTSSCGGMYMSFRNGDEWVAANTLLYDAPDGSVVGVVVREQWMIELDREMGWRLLALNTPWGITEAWAEPL